MADRDVLLPERWRDLAARIGWTGDEATAVGTDLIDRYREPHRHYHDTVHLAAVLASLDELSAPVPPPVVVELAAWFHDAVYAGRPGDDETASAQLARGRLADSPLAEPDVEAVAAMVESTARHMDPTADHDSDTALLLDADLSILAAPVAQYETYVGGVRAEHADVDDERFRRGRLAVVEALLARDPLFLTPAGRSRLEPAARQNLRREQQRLRT
ncbi:MAG: HD domain-containing protein [Acidimicrobiales bacterium]